MKQPFVIHPLDVLSRRAPSAKADTAARARGRVHRAAPASAPDPEQLPATPARRGEPAVTPGLQHPRRPLAWARYDGARVITAQEKSAHVSDGRSFQVEDFDVPLFAHPALTDDDRAALARLLEAGHCTPEQAVALRRVLGEA